MGKRFPSIRFDASVNVQLMCGCRMLVSPTAIFERKEFDCVWNKEHGSQRWLRFDPSDAGYMLDCRAKDCDTSRRYAERFLTCVSAARSHSRLHGHVVWVRVDGWVGLKIEPVLMVDLDLPPF